jgi:hypothetical protein
MWNYKNWKLEKKFQNWSIILKLQKSFTTYKWGIMNMMCWKKVVAYYTRKHTKNFKSTFGYDLKLLSFLKTKH